MAVPQPLITSAAAHAASMTPPADAIRDLEDTLRH
jgi:hypothetical protein